MLFAKAMLTPRLLASSLPKRTIQCLSQRTYSSAMQRVQLTFEVARTMKSPPADPKDGAILMLHGLFGARKNNRAMSKALAYELNREVYAIDLRNHGDAPHNPRHDYRIMAEDVAAFIAEHKLQNTTLIGHSMGAKVAMTLALQSPDLVNDIVSVDNAPIDAAIGSKFGTYVKAMKKIEEVGVSRQSEGDAILREVEDSLPIRQFLLSNLYYPVDGGPMRFRIPTKILGAALDNMGDFPFKDPDQVRFEKRALFVRGTKSHYVPDEALPIIGKFFPRFELADIDAGHWVISEQPQIFKDKVVEFLQPKE